MFEADLILDGARELNAEGKKERAAQAKNLIDKAAERAGKPDAFLEARRNAVLVTVENYIKTKEFEGALQAVDLFEKDVPASRYDPYFSSLRARAYLGFKETTAALLAIDRALILDPTSNYAPTLLDLKATIFETTLNKPGEAVKILQQILTDYPAYDKRTEIQERLKKLGK